MFEIYAYGNVDTLNGIFNALASIMGAADYLGLIKTVAVTGVLVAAFTGLFTPGRFHGWSWLFGFLFIYYALFLPKVEVIVVDKLGTQPPTVIANVPIGVAFFGHYTSLVGNVMTQFFETAFQVIPSSGAQLPAELTYQKNGVLFGNRLIEGSRKATVADPQLRTDLISYVYNCTFYDLQDGTINPNSFAQSSDIWSLMGTPNPGRFSTYGNPVQVDTCPNVYTYLNNALPAQVANAKSRLAFDIAARAAKGATAPSKGVSSAKGGPLTTDRVETSGGGNVNGSLSGTLRQQYQADLARAYDEVVRNTSQEQISETNDYARRTAQDEQFRHILSSSQRDTDQVNAQLTSARKHASQAQSHFAQRETFVEQARAAKSNTTSLGYEWARDPCNTGDVEALAIHLRDAQTPGQQRVVMERFMAEKSLLGRPTEYASGAGINWSDSDLGGGYAHTIAAPELQNATRSAHANDTNGIGRLHLTPARDHGLNKSSRETISQVKSEIEEAKRALSKGQVAADRRFGSQSGLGDQDRDGKFGSSQSTATRAFNNASEDIARSAENLKNAVEDASFGTVYRWLNGDKKK